MAWKDILKLDFNAKEFYVGKYRKIENYGGPEEGGWWYNNFDHIILLLRVTQILTGRFVG